MQPSNEHVALFILIVINYMIFFESNSKNDYNIRNILF